jgi:hypothetical protein
MILTQAAGQAGNDTTARWRGILWVLRGISKVTAAVTGLLLAYSFIYTMETIATRIPTIPLRELSVTTLWMLPWMLLFYSGVEDFGTVTRHIWVFWVGVTVALALLYYFQRYTSSSFLTKAAMPLLATAGGLLPHFVRRLNIVFTVSSLVAGVAGLVVLYLALASLLEQASSFANKGIGILGIIFGMASLATGVLSVASLRRYRTETA